MLVGFIATMHSVPITTKVMSSNLVPEEVYSIQHYVIKYVSDLRQIDVQDLRKLKRYDYSAFRLKLIGWFG
jgi:hypothetical protein